VNFVELKAMNWTKIYGEIDKDSLENYKDIDWKVAPLDTFIRLALPRGSEMGGIYHTEAIAILEACLECKPEFTLEIGTMHGTSTRLLAAIAQLFNGKMVSIDGNAGPGVRPNLELLRLDGCCELVKAWTPWVRWEYKEPLDFVFVDGDHSFISVLADYHYFNYYASPKCMFAFHDMNLVEVQNAVAEIIKRDNLKEISRAGRMFIYQKTTPPSEKYFELLSRGTDRGLLSTL